MFTKKALWKIGFFFIFCNAVYSQQQTHLDSLAATYASGKYNQQEELLILKELAEFSPDPDKKLAFCEKLVQASKAADSTGFLCAAYLQKGNALRLKSDLSKALENYILAAEIARQEQVGGIYIAIADVYSINENHNNAVNYYQKAITILEKQNDSLNVASALYNLGDEFIKYNKPDSALVYTKQAQEIFSTLNSDVGVAYSLGNMGIIYSKLGSNAKAEINLNKAIDLLQQIDEFPAICEYLNSMSDIYHEKGDVSIAISYALKSLDLAKTYGLKEQISSAALKLSQLYEDKDDTRNSLSYYKEYITYRDSVKNIESVEQMADLRTDFEVSRKQIEVDLLNQQKKNQQIIVVATAIALVLIFLLALGLFRRYTFIKKTNRIIEEERNRSDKLLLNILPEATAMELKLNGKVRAQKFESVTVLFTDFKGFTRYAENLSPEKVVQIVDFYFSKFDEIMEKYGLEKIKTIGDSYMCAGGMPFPSEDHACKMVNAAFEIAAFVHDSKTRDIENQVPFDIRIGINTGPVVAGIVGFKKFAYDIWGDTVNIASRMESNSEPGRINVSENTYELIKADFDCSYRGEIDVKNRGMLKMYFVNKAM